MLPSHCQALYCTYQVWLEASFDNNEACVRCLKMQSIGAYLRLWDLLTARRTCTQWADALAPSVTQLRVHLRSNPDPTPSHKLQDTQVAGYGLTDAAQQLSDALGRFPRVHSVTLLLSPDTSSQDLQQALRVVGCNVGGSDNSSQVISTGCASHSKSLPHQSPPTTAAVWPVHHA